MVNIYFTTCKKQVSQVQLLKYLSLFPIEIKNKILKFHRWQDAQASLFGKVLLVQAIKDFGLNTDISQLKYAKYGKPYLIGNTDFNISHSGQHIVCACSNEGSIGIDIEEIKPICINDFKKQFHNDEWSQIIKSDDNYESFYHYWTAKEAIIKADGRGMNIPLKNIILNNGVCIVDKQLWHYKKIALFDNCAIHIASSKEISDYNIIDVDLISVN